ncbi:hypothetical protein SDC9_120226 [bioreactor metagenome]|uniref:Uncharacterized protein n=1 Tax=bioreactor metagenome TaxID=1076179 RepID=A0A645C673_9ZZZZ
MPFYFFEEKNHDRNEDKNNPGTIKEFTDADDDYNNTGSNGAKTINKSTNFPIGIPDFIPVQDHAGLRNGKGKKNTYSIKGNKIFRFPLININ